MTTALARGRANKLSNPIPKEQYYLLRYKKARAVADLWIAILEACQHYTCSSRNLFYWTSQYQGAQKNARVYDTTGVAAVRKFVSKVQNAITPAQQKWALLKAGTDIPEEFRDEVNRELEKRNDIIFNYIRHSNFDLAINECYYDLSVGTAALLCNEGPDDDPLQFSSVPLARLAIEESYSGMINSNYRWWDEIKIVEVLLMWPNCKLTPAMQALYAQDPNAIVKNLIEGCIDTFGREKTKYVYFVMFENDLLYEEFTDSSPWIVFRWEKVNNEVHGRGPSMAALPSILTLNEMARLELATANFNASRPYMAMSDGVFQPWTFRMEANTIIPVATNAAGQFPLAPLPENTPPAFVQMTIQDLRNQINVLLYGDPLGPIESPTKTATEMSLRQRNLFEEIGPVYTRLQKEFLSKLMDRIIYVLQKKGFLEKLIVNGREIQYQYQSPLVADQGKLDVQTFGEFYNVMQGVYGPETAMTYLNPIEFPYWAADKLGVNPNIMNPQESMKQMLVEQSAIAEQKEMMMMEAGVV